MRANPLTEFMQQERFEFADANQLLLTHLWSAAQYYDFLNIILERYSGSNAIYLAHLKRQLSDQTSGTRYLTAEEVQQLAEVGQLEKKVHLEIESFYVFGKILLDHLALFQQDLFGLGQGCSLASHGKLVKGFRKYCGQKGLQYDEALVNTQQHLETVIGDYRDDRIEHAKASGILKATMFRLDTDDGPGTTRIGHTRLGAISGKVSMTPEPNVYSGEIAELSEAIDWYIEQVIGFVRSNKARIRFPTKA
jgi:hypothetical protein